MAIDQITKEVSGNITDLPAVYPIASVIPLNKDTIKAYNAAEEAIRATLADDIIPELRTIIADVNELTDQFNTFGTQVDAEGDAINQIKTDTQGIYNNTVSVKNATDVVYNATAAVKTATEEIYDDTVSVKNAADVVYNATAAVKTATEEIYDYTVQLKADTEQFKNDAETAKNDAVDAKDIAVQAAEDAQAAAAGDVIDDDVIGDYTTYSSSFLEDRLNNTIGTLTKSFAENEEYRITLSRPALPPVVSVTKEVPQLDLTNNTWDVNVGEFEQEGTDLEIVEGSISIPATVVSTELDGSVSQQNVVTTDSYYVYGNPMPLTTLSNGNIAVVWFTDTDNSVYFKIVDNEGNTVVADTQVATGETNGHYLDVVAVEDGFIIAFSSKAAKYNNSGEFVSLSTSTTFNSSANKYKRMIKLHNGKVLMFQADSNGSYYVIINQDLTEYLARVTISTAYGGGAQALALFDNGNVAIVWCDIDGDDEVRYIIVNEEGTIVKAITILDSTTVVNPNTLSACTLSNGDLIVSCHISNENLRYIYRVTPAYVVTDTTIGDCDGGAVVRSHENGEKFIVFYQDNPNSRNVIQQRGTDLTTVYKELVLATEEAYTGHAVGIAYGINGNIFITYTPGYGSSYLTGYISIIDGYVLSRPKNEYISAVATTAGEIDTTFWANLDTLTAAETLNGQTIYYALSKDGKDTWSISKVSDGVRNIARNNVGTWEYNSAETYGDETWTVATVNNEFQALSEAMSVAANRMDSTQMLALTETEHVELEYTLNLAVMLHTDSDTATPEFTGLEIQYDGNVKNQVCVPGADYEWSTYDGTTVELKALLANNLKIRVV